MTIKSPLLAALTLLVALSAEAKTKLDEHCIVNILNRTIQVSKEGGWALPNVPSNMGRVRARATCILADGSTVSGQSDYFNLTNNGITNVSEIQFDNLEATPTEINFMPVAPITLAGVGKTQAMKVVAKYRDGKEKDVTAAVNGINYSSTNKAIASVSAEGLVTAVGNGTAVINARKDGVLASQRVTVSTQGDLDQDGMPDDWEIANGLNPNDPVDAQEDKDGDGLSNLEEFKQGTNPALADSDGDGLKDASELSTHHTNPLLADSDGDGLNDNVEILTGTDPLKAASANYAAAVQSIVVTPPTVVMTFSGVDTEVSTQLTVTGKLIDGSTADLTSKARGTRYSSSDLAVVGFGAEDGKLFAGKAGNAVVTISNGTHSFPLAISVESFTPSGLSALAIPGDANNVDVTGDFAYVAAGSAGLQVVDVSNRRAPKIVGSLDTDGNAIDVRVRGNWVYLADGVAGLKIIDVSDATKPVLKGSLDTAGVTQDLQIYGNYAYLANGAGGIEVVDITKPDEPISVGVLSGLGEVSGIDIEGSTVTVVADSSLRTIDVSDKSSPIKVGGISLGAVKDLVVKDGYAYVAAYTNGYRVVDIRVPSYPRVTGGGADFYPNDLELDNRGLVFFAEVLFPNVIPYVNVQDPDRPVFQGTIDLLSFGNADGTGVALDSSFAYRTSGPSSLSIAHYRMPNDNAGIAPTVAVTNPTQGEIVIERKNLLLSAVADDDVAVKKVEFLVDGVVVATDTTAPYEVPFVAPSGKRFLNIQARATDLGGNVATSEPVRMNIQPDKDHDGLGDDEEADTYKTNPTNPDTDGDGLTDGREVALGANPLIADTDGDGLSDGDEVAQMTDPLNPDVTKPVVESSSPVADATEVPENQGIVIKFSEALSPKSINATVFSLKEQNSLPIEGSLKLVGAGKQLLFTPNELLKDYTEYVVSVEAVRDSAGNLLSTPFTFKYTTGNTTDIEAPTVAASTPTSSAVNVPVNASLTLVMSEPIDPTTVVDSKFYVTDAVTNQRIAGLLSVSEDKRSISFVPNRAFLVGRTHQVYVSGVKDLFGLEMNATSWNFTTAFEADGKSPELVATTVSEGDTEIPLNARLNALFDEPVSGLSLRLISLEQNGIAVPSNRVIESEGRRLSLKPIAPLQANTHYEFVIGAVADLSGNLLAHEKRIGFTTGAFSDTVSAVFTSNAPAGNSPVVPLTASLEIHWSERFDPATVLPRTFVLTDHTENDREVEGRIEISLDRKSLVFVPAQPLKAAHSYQLWASYHQAIYDLAGNSFRYRNWGFATSNAVDKQPPVITVANFAPGTANLPVNSIVRMAFNEPLNTLCVNSQTVSLVKAGDVTPIGGSVKLSSDSRVLSFVATANLLPSTAYELLLNNVCDLSGNTLDGVRHSFTTASTTVRDTAGPSLTNIVPALNAKNVSTQSSIVVSFSETIDPTQLGGLEVKASGVGGQVSGSWVTTGNTLIFTPLNGYPSNTQVNVSIVGVTDLAGNSIYSYSSRFTTATAVDTTPPQVLMMTPSNGDMDVGQLTPIVLTFSESLRESTVNTTNFMLFVDGAAINSAIYRSADNRTVTLTGVLPSAKSVTVVVTSDVTDIAGNPLADFASTFSTSIVNRDTSRPSIVEQSPVSGANSVRQLGKVTLYANKPLNAGTLARGIYVAADGVLVPGRSSLDDTYQAITFVPDQPFPDNALIEVFLTDSLRDTSGDVLQNYRGSFRTGNSTGSIPNQAPVLQASYPTSGANGVALNPLIEVSFDQRLKANSVNANTVQLRKDYSGAVQPAQLSLSDDGRVIRIKPSTPLEPSGNYYVRFYGDIEDVDGDKLGNETYVYFTVGANAVADTQPPLILATSPANGAVDVPANPVFHLRFDEPVHPFSVPTQGNDQISFLAGNTELRYVKDHVLKANSDNTETWSGITDGSGNAITDYSIHFKIGDHVDTTSPSMLSVTPLDGATNVPVNVVVKVLMSEAINAVAGSPKSLRLFDPLSGAHVDATTAISSDGMQLSLTPTAPLALNVRYTVYNYAAQDLAGNSGSVTSSFTTGFETDTQAPKISAVGIDQGQLNVPLNARLRVLFNEPINIQKLDGVALTLNGSSVPVAKSLSGDRLLLTLTPPQLLHAQTIYGLRVAGIEDLSGNTMVAPEERQFTTAAKVDNVRGSIINYVPWSKATAVPLNTKIEVRLSEPVDPATVLPRTFVVRDETAYGKEVDGRIDVSADRKGLSFIPAQPLKAAHSYAAVVGFSADLTDLCGNFFYYNFWRFTTGNAVVTQAPGVTTSSFDSGAVGLPVNPRVTLSFDEPLNQLCVNSQSVSLVKAGDTAAIPGAVTLAADFRSLTYIANSPLEASTAYELLVNNVCDLSGNALTSIKHRFTTGSTTVADTVRPTFTGIIPGRDTTGVSAQATIVATFNEAIDPTQLGSLQVTADGVSGQVAGSWMASGNTLTFTPLKGYPSYSRVNVYLYGVMDLAGNSMSSNSSSFTTGASVDTTPPQVLMMTPSNGDMDVGPLTPIVLTFSESLLESTVNNTNFMLFVDGEVITPAVYRSADNRTITLTGALPSAKSVTVVVTSDVTDIAGNPLADFASTFSTVNTDTSRTSIVLQSPVSGANNVRQLGKVTLYANKPLNAGTLARGIYVAADGVLVPGRSSLDETYQAISFVPDRPLPDNALIEVFLTDSVRDTSGDVLQYYRGSFRTGNSTGSIPNQAPVLQASYPTSGANGVALNPLIQVSFDQRLKANSVNANTVQIRKDYSGAMQPAEISLSDDGRVIRIKPSTPLEPGGNYYVRFYGDIEDLDGDKLRNETYIHFTVGANAVADTQSPLILSTSPANGAVEVPVNPAFHVRFDEPVHPFSVPTQGNDQISFLAGNTELRYVKDHVLKANSDNTETWSGITDGSGNAISDYSIHFKTGDRLDTASPSMVSVTPSDEATNVPVNVVVTMLMSEAINALAVSPNSFYLYDSVTGAHVDSTTAISSDGMQLSLTPAEPLGVNRRYTIFNYPAPDLAGNVGYGHSSFTTGFEADTQAPQITAVGIDQGQLDVPLNARFRVRFSEPVIIEKLDGMILSRSGSPVKAATTLSDDRQLLTLTPSELLQPNTGYQLTIAGVQDLSGNVVAKPDVRLFTTSSKVEGTSSKTFVSTIPAGYQSEEVALNTKIEARFSLPVDPATLLSSTLVLSDETDNAKNVGGRTEITADRKGIRFVPDQLLEPLHRYYVSSNYLEPFSFLAGNVFSGTSWYWSFTTGDTVDSKAPAITAANFASGSDNIPVNPRIALLIDEELSDASVNNQTVRLVKVGTTTSIPGKISYSDRLLTFKPSLTLASSTTYELLVNNVVDLAGNPLPSIRHSFTTGSGAPDISVPDVSDLIPLPWATGVSTQAKIVVRCSEVVDPTLLGSWRVYATGVNGQVAGSWAVAGTTVTFTPLNGYPPNALVTVYLNPLSDMAGNYSSYRHEFYTGM